MKLLFAFVVVFLVIPFLLLMALEILFGVPFSLQTFWACLMITIAFNALLSIHSSIEG